MGYSVSAEKSVWVRERWNFVGAEGSRAKPLEQVKKFLSEDSNEASALCLEGVWGIGKSSLIAYAVESLLPEQQIRYVLYAGVEPLKWHRPSGGTSLPDSFSGVISFLKMHTRENILVIIRVRDDTKSLVGDHLNILSEFSHFCPGLRLVLEIYQYQDDFEQQLKNGFSLFSDLPIRVVALADDEAQKLITGKQTVNSNPSTSDFDLLTYIGEEELLQEIRRWAGGHPYALQIISHAVAVYYDSERTRRDEIKTDVHGYVKTALSRQMPDSADAFMRWCNEFRKHIFAILDGEIQGFLKNADHSDRLKSAGLICSGPNIIHLLKEKNIQPPLKGPLPDEALLKALRELVYWYWLNLRHPAMVRESLAQEIDNFMREIRLDNIARWFGQAPYDAVGNIDRSEQTRQHLLEKASNATQNDPLWGPRGMSDTINRKLVQWLRTEMWFDKDDELQIYYQDYTSNAPTWDNIRSQNQATIADKLVKGAIHKAKLDKLVIAMSKPV